MVERWKNGGMEWWNDGRMREWNDGMMEEWKNGRVYHGGTKNMEMEGWGNGMLRRWPKSRFDGNGKMEFKRKWCEHCCIQAYIDEAELKFGDAERIKQQKKLHFFDAGFLWRILIYVCLVS